MRILTGNTYEIKDIIKSKGGKWDALIKAWKVPENVYQELQQLANSTKKSNYTSSYNNSSRKGKFECGDCGDDVYSGTSCWETGLTH